MDRPKDEKEREEHFPFFEPSATDEDFRSFSPLTYIRPTFPPTCFIYGSGDDPKAFMRGTKMHQELHERGVHTDYHLYAAAPHCFTCDPELMHAVMEHSILFLDRIFRPKKFRYPIEGN